MSSSITLFIDSSILTPEPPNKLYEPPVKEYLGVSCSITDSIVLKGVSCVKLVIIFFWFFTIKSISPKKVFGILIRESLHFFFSTLPSDLT